MIRDLPLSRIVRMVEEGGAFVRYGDGEIQCMTGHTGQNADKHQYTLALRQALLRAAQHPHADILYGLQPHAWKFQKHRNFIRSLPISEWWNADVLHDASIKGELCPFVAAVRKKKTLMVGPARIAAAATKLGCYHQIEIPEVDCFTAHDAILRELVGHLSAEVVLFSASMMTNVLIATLVPAMPATALIDVGAVWEPYCGIKTRGYHPRLSEETLRRNLS